MITPKKFLEEIKGQFGKELNDLYVEMAKSLIGSSLAIGLQIDAETFKTNEKLRDEIFQKLRDIQIEVAKYFIMRLYQLFGDMFQRDDPKQFEAFVQEVKATFFDHVDEETLKQYLNTDGQKGS